MKITIRGPVFETNSSSEHTFILISKGTYEAWKRGEVRIEDGCFGEVYRDVDFIDAKKPVGKKYPYWSKGTYKDFQKYISELGIEMVLKEDASEKYVLEEDLDAWNDPKDDLVNQKPYVEIKDDGKNVRIHTWGRY